MKRVDAEAKTLIGSLTTDATGSFEGNLFLPLSLPVGDYEVKVATPGDARPGHWDPLSRGRTVLR